jgi:hypothetical protein
MLIAAAGRRQPGARHSSVHFARLLGSPAHVAEMMAHLFGAGPNLTLALSPDPVVPMTADDLPRPALAVFSPASCHARRVDRRAFAIASSVEPVSTTTIGYAAAGDLPLQAAARSGG